MTDTTFYYMTEAEVSGEALRNVLMRCPHHDVRASTAKMSDSLSVMSYLFQLRDEAGGCECPDSAQFDGAVPADADRDWPAPIVIVSTKDSNVRKTMGMLLAGYNSQWRYGEAPPSAVREEVPA